jgi:hypothetical protein
MSKLRDEMERLDIEAARHKENQADLAEDSLANARSFVEQMVAESVGKTLFYNHLYSVKPKEPPQRPWWQRTPPLEHMTTLEDIKNSFTHEWNPVGLGWVVARESADLSELMIVLEEDARTYKCRRPHLNQPESLYNYNDPDGLRMPYVVAEGPLEVSLLATPFCGDLGFRALAEAAKTNIAAMRNQQ